MDVKSFTTIDVGKKEEIHTNATGLKQEAWFEDKLPGDGRAVNSFSSLYDVSWNNESDTSKNKSWFDMVEEDEAGINSQCSESVEKQIISKEPLGLPLNINIKKEVIEEETCHVNSGNHQSCSSGITPSDTKRGMPVNIKEEKICNVTYAATVATHDKCAIVVKSEKTVEKSVHNKALSQENMKICYERIVAKNVIKIEKQSESENLTVKQDSNSVGISKVDVIDQSHLKIKKEVGDKDVNQDSSSTVKQDGNVAIKKSYAAIVSKGGSSNHVIIKQEVSPEKKILKHSCNDACPQECMKMNMSENNLEENTIKQDRRLGSAALKRERDSINNQKIGSDYQRGKKIKQEISLEDFTDTKSIKFIKQPQDDDNSEECVSVRKFNGKSVNSEANRGLYSTSRKIKDYKKRPLDSSSESLNLKRERSGSSSSSSTNSLHRKREYERDPEVLARRQKQIDYGKNTVGYDNYRQQIPKEMRTSRHPRTPPKHIKYSRRGWDGMVRIWRQQLHVWDPATEGGERDLFDSASEVSGEAGSITSDEHNLLNVSSASGSVDDIHQDDDYLNLDHDNLSDLVY